MTITMNKQASIHTMNRIINRYASKKQQYLSKPYSTNTGIMITDSFQLAHLSSNILATEYDNKHLSSDSAFKLFQLEHNFINNNNNPTTSFQMDDISLKQLIQSIKYQQAELATKQTNTTLIYHASHYELEVITTSNDLRYSSSVYDSVCNVSEGSESFVIILDTQHLLNSLMTHNELYSLSESMVTVQYSKTKPQLIKFVNDVATTVNIQPRV